MAGSLEAKGLGLSLRISARTRFALEFASQLLGQSFSTFIERSVMRAAGTDALLNGKSWETYWDDSEAVRWLKVYLEPKYPLEHDEARRRAVVLAHREFFYDANGEPNLLRAEVLWPQLEHYAELWQKTKGEHPLMVGEKLVERVKKAGLKSPAWPPK